MFTYTAPGNSPKGSRIIRSIAPSAEKAATHRSESEANVPLKSPALKSSAPWGDPSEGAAPVTAKEAYHLGPPTTWLISSRTCHEAQGVAFSKSATETPANTPLVDVNACESSSAPITNSSRRPGQQDPATPNKKT